jgi:hypothetical protein
VRIVVWTFLSVGARGQRDQAFPQTSSGLPDVDEAVQFSALMSDAVNPGEGWGEL